jgi:gas vesicle protein
MDSGKLVLGVLIGVTVGATLGILFAPDKGSTTRQKIVDRGEGYADDVKEKLDEFISSITGRFEKAKEEATEFASKVKKNYNETKKETDHATA